LFGTVRFVLALLVVATHVGVWIWPGMYAVFGFYVISGYLMCLVLDRRYGFTAAGFRAYCVNRALRIYPPYWAAALLSLVLLTALGQEAASEHWPHWVLPTTARAWLDNFLLVTLPPGSAGETLLIPPAWALRVELFYYLVLGLGLGRNRAIAFYWFLAAVAFHVYLADTNWNGWRERYYTIPAASLPFSLGALIYHSKSLIPERVGASRLLPAAIVALWVVNLLAAPNAFGSVIGVGRFYLNLALVAAFVALMSLRRASSPRWRRLDARLGDLSYPVYLLHMQIGFGLLALGLVPRFDGAELLRVLAALPVILLFAWAMLRLVDDPVERLRDRVKLGFEAAQSANREDPE
jgi:peptidoglycan/LPS O-acetylase OafA/YrhL